MHRSILSFLITVFLIFGFSLITSNAQTQQVWTYDFGDNTGTYTSTANSTTFLPNADPGGGTAVVRAGGGAGLFLENPGNPDLGTYSQLRLTASSSTAMNRFEIEEFSNPTNQFYIKFTIRLIEGESGEHEFLIGSGGNFGTNNSSRPNAFTALTWSFSEAGIETVRRTPSGTASTSGIGSSFLLDTIYDVEIYGNNTTEAQTYYRNGEQFTVTAGQWDLWLNGSIEGSWDGQLVNLESGDIIDSFRFQSRNSENNQAEIEIDDIVYSNSLPDIRTIEGVAGWRMLALPYDTPVEQLARQNLVQGITGGDFAGAGANIFTSHTGSESDEDWSAPADINEQLNRGKGFIWGLYDNANIVQSKPLPMALTITGSQEPGDVVATLTDANDGWNLLGNPFSEDLDLTAEDGIENWADGTVTATVQIYDPDSDGYILSTDNNNKVAAFQGFFLQNENASSLTFPEDASGGDDATFYKQEDDQRLISFKISAADLHSGKSYTDRAFNLFFTENSTHEWDIWDAGKLTPFSEKFIGMAFVGERDGELRLKAQESRPSDLQQPFSVPVEFYSTGVAGTAELSIHQIENIPSDWMVQIEDTQTGIRQILSKDQPFTFDFSVTQQIQESSAGSMAAPVVTAAKVGDESPRFMMHISPGEDFVSQLPDDFQLHQNYPNPFNPTTVISYELPQAVDVTLEVYDMLGRQVSTLVDGRVNAGTHQVTFDAGNLSSGVYIYRLSAGEQMFTRKLTVLK